MTDRRRVADLFDQCLDLPPAERAALLARECAGDPALRGEVEELLAADGGAAAAALDELTPHRSVELQPGELVAGRYRVLRWLGQGGMGTVYEAEQLQPQRRVALKCLRAGAADAATLRRFQREGELLGRLRHPGIAQILEAGFADERASQPFFAMEFVQGPPLLEHARSLGQRERLELFAEVCDAVQHAHSLGIVHRDLKPANILVDTGSAPPRPKVLDFGVGRALAGDTPDTLLTGTHEIVGTLAYLSPEQVASGSSAVDARADVWSLGVTLYQLLAHRLPLDFTGRTLPEAGRILQDEEPTRIDRLVSGLRGDVATIVHTALAKEPQRRYANAGELAADLRRHLRSEPIAARPTSALYQLSRFARRHRAVVSGLAATFVALVAGLCVSLHFLAGEKEQRGIAESQARDLGVLAQDLTTQRNLAERRAGDVRALARDLIFDVEEQLATVAGATAARRKVVATGLRYAEGLLQDAGDDPRLLTEVGLAFRKLAEILGDTSKSNLGDIPAAEAALHKAIATLERAAAVAPDPGPPIAGLIQCRNLEAELHRSQGRTPERLQALQQVRDLAGRLAALGHGEDADLDLADAAANLGRVQADAGQYADAIGNFELYLAVQRRLIGTSDPVAARNAAMILGYIGDFKRRLGDPQGCRKALDEALSIAEAFQREHPDDVTARRALVEALRGLSIDETLLHRPADALPWLERAQALLAQVPIEPADVAAVRLQVIVDFDLATVLIDLDRSGEAKPLLADYQERSQALLRRTPENRNRARDVMIGHQLTAKMYGRLHDGPAVARSLAAALEGCRAAVAADGRSAAAWEDLDRTQRVGAHAWCEVMQAAAAEDQPRLRQQAIELFEAENATMAQMAELGIGKHWIPARQQAVARMLEGLRAGKNVELK